MAEIIEPLENPIPALTPEGIPMPDPPPGQQEGYERLLEKIKEPNPPFKYDKHSASLTQKLRSFLQRHPENLDKIVNSLVRMATENGRNQFKAIQEIFDRLDGKAVQRLADETERPMKLVLMPADQAPIKTSQLTEGEADSSS